MIPQDRPRPDEQGAAADRKAEEREEIRQGRWDPPQEYEDPGPDGYGWAPDPYPDSGLI